MFEQIIDRQPSYAFKWEKYKDRDILPMWVADMEFKCAQPILDALHRRVEHGVLGYTLPAHYTPANEAVCHWLEQQYQWKIEPEWILWTPGVVPAFNVACQAYCQPGDKVMVQTPNYPPLLAAPALNQMQKVEIPTLEVDQRWTLDFAEFERQAADPKCKLVILCNPMNPVGSVLTENELQQVAEICNKHDVLLCSDEIHCDLILDPQAKHIPAGAVESLKHRSVTLMAASKTFNVAGLGASFAIVPDPNLRRRFSQASAGMVPWVNIMGLVATEAAFTLCQDWHHQLLEYLRGNLEYLHRQINALPGLKLLPQQATFLAWIDASGLGVEDPQAWFENKGLGPSPGLDFGDKSFIRINFGSPRVYLEQAIQRLHTQER